VDLRCPHLYYKIMNMNDIYHVLSRGVDKRKIFLNKQDYFRFVHNLFVLNNQDVVYTTHYNKTVDLRCPQIQKKPRKLLVNIHVFCLMPNHYHLLLSPRIEDGIPRFMKKINMAYAKYFNQKYNRKGTLFESRYKSIEVINESHFYYLPYYIHFNPLDLKFSEWRKGELKDYKEATKLLENYYWSSHLDYMGKKNFPSVTNRKFLLEVFNGEEGYKKSIDQRLKDLELEDLKELILE